jgi:hypothetical protein
MLPCHPCLCVWGASPIPTLLLNREHNAMRPKGAPDSTNCTIAVWYGHGTCKLKATAKQPFASSGVVAVQPQPIPPPPPPLRFASIYSSDMVLQSVGDEDDFGGQPLPWPLLYAQLRHSTHHLTMHPPSTENRPPALRLCGGSRTLIAPTQCMSQ